MRVFKSDKYINSLTNWIGGVSFISFASSTVAWIIFEYEEGWVKGVFVFSIIGVLLSLLARMHSYNYRVFISDSGEISGVLVSSRKRGIKNVTDIESVFKNPPHSGEGLFQFKDITSTIVKFRDKDMMEFMPGDNEFQNILKYVENLRIK